MWHICDSSCWTINRKKPQKYDVVTWLFPRQMTMEKRSADVGEASPFHLDVDKLSVCTSARQLGCPAGWWWAPGGGPHRGTTALGTLPHSALRNTKPLIWSGILRLNRTLTQRWIYCNPFSCKSRIKLKEKLQRKETTQDNDSSATSVAKFCNLCEHLLLFSRLTRGSYWTCCRNIFPRISTFFSH